MYLPFPCYSSHGIPCPFDYAAELNAKRQLSPFLFDKKVITCKKIANIYTFPLYLGLSHRRHPEQTGKAWRPNTIKPTTLVKTSWDSYEN